MSELVEHEIIDLELVDTLEAIQHGPLILQREKLIPQRLSDFYKVPLVPNAMLFPTVLYCHWHQIVEVHKCQVKEFELYTVGKGELLKNFDHSFVGHKEDEFGNIVKVGWERREYEIVRPFRRVL